MAGRDFFAFFGVCCAAALTFFGLLCGVAYLVGLLPDDMPSRMERAGILTVSSAEESRAPEDESHEQSVFSKEAKQAAEESSPEETGLIAVASLDLSRKNAKDGLSLQNETSYKINLSDYADISAAAGDIRGAPPTVLIYHTHGTESYSPGASYDASYGFRSEDITQNVVSAGEALCDSLRACGIFALHDEIMYDKDDFSAAYTKSRAAVEEWLIKYPTVRYVIDIHRDSVSSSGSAAAAVAEIEGRRAAQIMFVVGTDEKAGRHTGWETNLALAVKLQSALAAISPSLVRPVYLRKASFNQDVSPGALLIEIGSQGNTAEEAAYSAYLLAKVMAECLSGE